MELKIDLGANFVISCILQSLSGRLLVLEGPGNPKSTLFLKFPDLFLTSVPDPPKTPEKVGLNRFLQKMPQNHLPKVPPNPLQNHPKIYFNFRCHLEPPFFAPGAQNGLRG